MWIFKVKSALCNKNREFLENDEKRFCFRKGNSYLREQLRHLKSR